MPCPFSSSFAASDLPRSRFSISPCGLPVSRLSSGTSLLYAAGNGLEIVTYVFPASFLVLAAAANSFKQISMLTSSATRNTIYRSFARGENIGDITAKGEWRFSPGAGAYEWLGWWDGGHELVPGCARALACGASQPRLVREGLFASCSSLAAKEVLLRLS